MNDAAPKIDAILSARLDLLEQVLKEVEEIREEMGTQKETLEAIERFLADDGDLHKTRGDAMLKVKRAADALDYALETREDEKTRDALDLLQLVQPLLKSDLDTLRKGANSKLLELKRWSVAALDDTRLRKAEELYDRSLKQIRDSAKPWAEYEAQIASRGEALFSAYLDMLGSIAIRGIPLGDDLADESKNLIKLLIPRRVNIDDPPLRALNLLTRSEHIQLGYRGWNVWALPLLGQEVGLHLIRNGHVDYQGEDIHRVICADAYALYVLGPSYAAAAIFLELDPGDSGARGEPSDQVRAQLLLEHLPRLAPSPQANDVSAYADKLREAWDGAVAGVGAEKDDVSDDLRAVTRTFLDRVSEDNLGLNYDLGNLGDRGEDAEQLTHGQRPKRSSHPRDLLVSMWWARVNKPEAYRLIDTGAREALLRTIPNASPPPGNKIDGRDPR